MKFHFMYILHFLYPFIHQWTFRLLPCLSYCERLQWTWEWRYLFEILISIPLEIYPKVPGLTFKSLIRFKVIFCVVYDKGPISLFFYGYSVFPVLFIEETVFCPLGILVSIVKDHLTCLFLGSLFCSIGLYINFLSVSSFFDYSVIFWSQEMGCL